MIILYFVSTIIVTLNRCNITFLSLFPLTPRRRTGARNSRVVQHVQQQRGCRAGLGPRACGLGFSGSWASSLTPAVIFFFSCPPLYHVRGTVQPSVGVPLRDGRFSGCTACAFPPLFPLPFPTAAHVHCVLRRFFLHALTGIDGGEGSEDGSEKEGRAGSRTRSMCLREGSSGDFVLQY
jgi:hypothetical protein